MSGYSFDDQEDEGIFADDPPAAAGDPHARADMELQSWVPQIALGVGPDGLIEMPPDDGGPSVLDDPGPISPENFICLGGPCKHYTENARLIPEGPNVDAEANIEVGRWCGRVRTWAEQTDLTEAEIYGCNCYDPDPPPKSWFQRLLRWLVLPSTVDPSRETKEKNKEVLAEVHRQKVEAGVFLDLCCVGPCEDYVEMIVKTPSGEDAEARRYCMRLGGLGRLYDLREKPVIVCTGWKPLKINDAVRKAAEENERNINKYRKAMAERPKQEDTDG